MTIENLKTFKIFILHVVMKNVMFIIDDNDYS